MIPSQFANTCKVCGEPIGIGEWISNRRIEQYGWAHAACVGAKIPEASTSTPAPEASTSTPEASTPEASTPTPHGVIVDSQLFQTLISELNRVAGAIVDVKDANAALAAEVENLKSRPVVITESTKPAPAGGFRNAAFDEVLQLATIGEDMLLVGPTGSGKTHLAKQVADTLGRKFDFVSCSAGMSEGHLLGRLLPIGKNGRFVYVSSEFVRRYENGGVFLLDELDAADENLLLVINAAIANGRLALPNRPEKPYADRHPDFVLIAAANTWGTGADRQYCGRNRLDEATLDRFRLAQVTVDYDLDLESELCPNAELCSMFHDYRTKITEHKLERVVSTRTIYKAYRQVSAGRTIEQIERSFFAGWRADEVIKVRGGAL